MTQNNPAKWTVDGTVIKISGFLGGADADGIGAQMDANRIYALDFKEVDDVNFAAMRSFLRQRRNGKKFSVINAEAAIAEKFEETGVSAFIKVTRKPRPLQIGRYDEFGAGYLSKAFNSEDGDSMLKVYGPNVSKWKVAQEKMVARAVMQFGIPTPLVGFLYEDGENTGLDFERIEGKRSLSRIISEEPERMEEIAKLFAGMCKELHSTPCDTDIFTDRTIFYRDTAAKSEVLTCGEKKKVLEFIDSIPPQTTCLHGDMQPSNVITNGKDTLWIDLAEFGYGNNMLDMGMLYFLCNLISEELSDHIFHLDKAQAARFWEIFLEEYFQTKDKREIDAINSQAKKYAALHMLYVGTCYGYEDGMVDFIREQLTK